MLHWRTVTGKADGKRAKGDILCSAGRLMVPPFSGAKPEAGWTWGVGVLPWMG